VTQVLRFFAHYLNTILKIILADVNNSVSPALSLKSDDRHALYMHETALAFIFNNQIFDRNSAAFINMEKRLRVFQVKYKITVDATRQCISL